MARGGDTSVNKDGSNGAFINISSCVCVDI